MCASICSRIRIHAYFLFTIKLSGFENKEHQFKAIFDVIFFTTLSIYLKNTLSLQQYFVETLRYLIQHLNFELDEKVLNLIVLNVGFQHERPFQSPACLQKNLYHSQMFEYQYCSELPLSTFDQLMNGLLPDKVNWARGIALPARTQMSKNLQFLEFKTKQDLFCSCVNF